MNEISFDAQEALYDAVETAFNNRELVLDALYDINIEFIDTNGDLPPEVQQFGQTLLDKYV